MGFKTTFSFIPLQSPRVHSSLGDAAHVHSPVRIERHAMESVFIYYFLVVSPHRFPEIRDPPPQTKRELWMKHFRNFAAQNEDIPEWIRFLSSGEFLSLMNSSHEIVDSSTVKALITVISSPLSICLCEVKKGDCSIGLANGRERRGNTFTVEYVTQFETRMETGWNEETYRNTEKLCKILNFSPIHDYRRPRCCLLHGCGFTFECSFRIGFGWSGKTKMATIPYFRKNP